MLEENMMYPFIRETHSIRSGEYIDMYVHYIKGFSCPKDQQRKPTHSRIVISIYINDAPLELCKDFSN